MITFLWSLPDGKLHLYFCDVGQGDAAYIRMPDGRDMLIDGGPDEKVIACLSRHMPFWDRRLDLVVASHPQKDHIGGLVGVLKRYRVGEVVRSDVVNPDARISTEFAEAVAASAARVRLAVADDRFGAGAVRFRVIWPSVQQISLMRPKASAPEGNVLGSQIADPNDGSVVILLSYGLFDAFFPGDADSHVNYRFIGADMGPDPVEVIKVPHHGSRGGMNDEFLDWLHPEMAVISVGKNNYGHPAPEILDLLKKHSVRVYRTDEAGDIEVTTDGLTWKAKP